MTRPTPRLPPDKQGEGAAEIEGLTGDEALDEEERINRKWASVEALVGSEKRLALVADDLVHHFETAIAWQPHIGK